MGTTNKKDAPVAIEVADLQKAYDGSWYCIAGAGGDLQEWVTGYGDMLKEQEIGAPSAWFQTNGAAVNRFAEKKNGGELVARDAFPDDLTILLFPLDGLAVGGLALFKLQMADRWFDDVVENMRVR